MQKTTRPPENKMGTMAVGPLLVSVSLPIVLSMLVQALYNVVDSIFVARLSEGALTAVSLVFPIQNLMIAVGVGTGVGINSLLSRRLGEKNFEAANKTAMNGLFLTLLSWLAFVLLGIGFTDLFFSGYAAHPEVGGEIAQMGSDYMRIVTICSPGVFFGIIFERLLQATGRSLYSMVSQMAGAITNIILDPIMIFGLLGFPAMGVAGAAWATVIGQLVGVAISMTFNFTRNPDIRLSLKGFRPDAHTIKGIYQVGLPSILMQSIGSIMVFALNQILVAFGSTPVSVLGIYFKLQSFIFMPVFGFNNGLVPVVAYNFGARNPKRIEEALRIGITIVFCIMLVGTALFWLIPGWLLTLFDASPNMLEIGTDALRIISLSFPIAAFVILLIGFFQAVGKGMNSLVLSVVRQLVFLLPIAWVLSRVSGLPALWAAFPIAEVASLVLSVWLFRRAWRELIAPMKTPGPPAGKPPAG